MLALELPKANRLWATSGDFMRGNGFYENWARYGGKKLTDEQIGQIIKGMNRMTGISSKNRLGSHANMILFAPRFIQSQFENMWFRHSTAGLSRSLWLAGRWAALLALA